MEDKDGERERRREKKYKLRETEERKRNMCELVWQEGNTEEKMMEREGRKGDRGEGREMGKRKKGNREKVREKEREKTEEKGKKRRKKKKERRKYRKIVSERTKRGEGKEDRTRGQMPWRMGGGGEVEGDRRPVTRRMR